MATPMSEEQLRAFLQEGTRTGKLATTRADGRPHVAPIWFVVDESDGSIVFNTGAESVKGRTIARDPRIALVRRRRPAALLVRGRSRASPR